MLDEPSIPCDNLAWIPQMGPLQASRSLSARSSKSIVFSRPGSSGRAGAGAVTNRLDHALQALATALLNCTTLFCSARHSRHRDLPRRVPPLPIEPFEQGGELGCGQPHGPVLDL